MSRSDHLNALRPGDHLLVNIHTSRDMGRWCEFVAYAAYRRLYVMSLETRKVFEIGRYEVDEFLHQDEEAYWYAAHI